MSDWLDLMLDEIDRKEREREEAEAESAKRDAERRSQRQDCVDDDRDPAPVSRNSG